MDKDFKMLVLDYKDKTKKNKTGNVLTTKSKNKNEEVKK